MILLVCLLSGVMGEDLPPVPSHPQVALTPPPDPQADSPAVLYLPLGGGAPSGCQSAAGARLTQVTVVTVSRLNICPSWFL